MARTPRLDLGRVETLRKEFLMLLKNVKIVRDFAQAQRWKEAVQIWATQFEAYMSRVRGGLVNLTYADGQHISDADVGYWRRRISGEVSPLLAALRVPLEKSVEPHVAFERMQAQLPTWEKRVRAVSRKVWAVLKDFVEWYARVSQGQSIALPQDENMAMAGFQVAVKGFIPEYRGMLDRIRAGLEMYRERAKRFLPLLLRGSLPIVLDFEERLSTGGRYNSNHIAINPFVIQGKPQHVVEVVAHEQAHHLYRTYLSGASKDFWTRAISGNYGRIDLWDVWRKYRGSSALYDNPRILSEDPILYLQIEGLQHMPEAETALSGVRTMEDLHEYLEDGGQSTFTVHGIPITGYAHKNDEEAFCEAVSLLVSHGPRALLPEVRMWLETILPSVRSS